MEIQDYCKKGEFVVVFINVFGIIAVCWYEKELAQILGWCF